MITDSSLIPERLRTRSSLTFRPKPERIGDESLIRKVSLFVLTTSGVESARHAIENRNQTNLDEHFFDFALTFPAIPYARRRRFQTSHCGNKKADGAISPPASLLIKAKVSRARRIRQRPCRRRCKVSPDRAWHHGAAFRKATLSERARRRHLSDVRSRLLRH